MPALERRLGPRGPRFWMDGATLMFANQFDGSTRDGPREATDEDIRLHHDAHEASLVVITDDTGREIAAAPGVPLVTFKTPAKRRG